MSVSRFFKFAAFAAGASLLAPSPARAQTEDYSRWEQIRGFSLTSPPTLRAPVANYPLLFRLDSAHADVFKEAKPGGADLRFRRVDSHGGFDNHTDLQLNYQIVYWDSAARKAEIWVLMDTVKPTEGIDVSNFPRGLLMYWGKPDAPARSNAGAVFDTANGFMSVWHMGGSSPTAARPNAVVGGSAAVPSGSNVASGFPLRQGAIGLADTLRGGTGTNLTARSSDDHFNLGSGYANFNGEATLSLWLKPPVPSTSAWNVYMAFGNGAPGDNLTIGRMGGTDNVFGEVYEGTTGAGRTEFNGVLKSNAWQYVTFAVKGVQQTVYHDGRDSVSRVASATIPNVTRAMAYLGRSLWADPNPAMAIDEVRLSKVRRSADWVRLDYETQKPGSNALQRYTPVPTPVLTAPAANAPDVPAFTTLTWENQTINRYRVQFSTDSLFLTPIFDSLVSNPILYLGPLPGGTYFWRVRGLELLRGTGPWSATRKFTVRPQPAQVSAPTLVSPAQFATGVGPNSRLTWNHGDGATSYQLQVATTPDFSAKILNDSGITLLFRQSSRITFNTAYYWRVRGWNAQGPGPWSEIWAFETVVSTPIAPTLLAPEPFASGLPTRAATLSWNPVSGATSYRVQVSLTPEFTAFVSNDTTVATSRTLGTLSAFTDYYWRVNAKNFRGTSAYSATRKFTTGETTALAPRAAGFDALSLSRVGEDRVVRLVLDRPERVTIRWRDLRGGSSRLVRDERLSAGAHTLRIPGAPGGVGLLEINVGGSLRTLLTAP